MKKFKGYFSLLSKGLITILLLFFVSREVDFSSLKIRFMGLQWHFILISFSLLLIQVPLMSYRWSMILNKELELFTQKKLILTYWLGLFFNQILPSSIGGDFLRGYYLNSEGNKKFIYVSVILDRFMGLYSLSILSFFSSLFFIDLNESYFFTFIYIVFFSLCLMVVFVSLFGEKKLFSSKTNRIFIYINYLLTEARTLFLSNLFLNLILISILLHLLSITSVFFISKGLGINIGYEIFLIIVPVVLLFVSIPISFGGWGLRENIFVITMLNFSIPGEDSLAISLLFGIMTVLISLPGLYIWVKKYF